MEFDPGLPGEEDDSLSPWGAAQGSWEGRGSIRFALAAVALEAQKRVGLMELQRREKGGVLSGPQSFHLYSELLLLMSQQLLHNKSPQSQSLVA